MAGLLDFLQSAGLLGPQSPYDPQTYSPQSQQAAQYAMPWANLPPMSAPSPFPAQQPEQQGIPPNAQPAMAQPPRPMPQVPSSPLAPASEPGVGDRLNAGLQGFVNSGGPLPAIGNLISGLMTGQRNDPAGVAQNSIDSTYRALKASGVPEPVARAAALNPTILSTVATNYFDTKPQFTKIGQDVYGNEKYGFVRPNQMSVVPADASGGAGASGSVGNIDQSKTGDEYLAQFPQDIQASVKAYMNGDVMPTGNARKGSTELIKRVALKYGQDLGIPVSDSIYNSKRKMQMDIGSSSPNSMGGILSNGKSAFAHLGELSDKAVDLGNYSLNGLPGGGAMANAANAVTNAFGDSSTLGRIKGFQDNALKYGQEATKFYAGTGGGEAERMNTLNTLNPKQASGPELASYLETERSLMMDRLRQKESQVRDVMGDGYLQAHPVVTSDLKSSIAKIDANIAKLRSGAAPDAAPAPAAQAPAATGWKYLGTR